MIEILAFIIFIAIVVAFIIKDRKNITLSGIVFMRKTYRGKAFLDKSAKRAPRLWAFIAVAAAVVGIGAMIFTSYFVLNCTYGLSTGQGSCFKLVLPGPSSSPQGVPGVPFEKSPALFLPWYFWVIGIATVMIPHEFFHGIICRLKGIRIKYLGWILLLFLPGAFVEPDKKQLDNSSRLTKIKVYSAGSFANLLMASLFLILYLVASTAFIAPGTQFQLTTGHNYPAESVNLSGTMLSINGTSVGSYYDIGPVLEKLPVGSNITVVTTNGEYKLATIQHPDLNYSRSFIGIEPWEPAPVQFFIMQLFFWIFAINLGVGLFNLLPLKPLDGGLVFEEIIGKFTRHARKITIVMSIIFGALIIINIIGPIFIG